VQLRSTIQNTNVTHGRALARLPDRGTGKTSDRALGCAHWPSGRPPAARPFSVLRSRLRSVRSPHPGAFPAPRLVARWALLSWGALDVWLRDDALCPRRRGDGTTPVADARLIELADTSLFCRHASQRVTHLTGRL
jgi:hypothetical protein